MITDKTKKQELENIDKINLLDAETLLEQDMEEIIGGKNYCECQSKAKA